MTAPVVVVHRDAQVLAAAAAARLITRIVDVQSATGEASVVLTGGRIGTAVLAAVAGSRARDAVDWGRLDVWWGDERFLPNGHPERNETQAREALLDNVPVNPERVHPMPASDGPDGEDLDRAAQRYADLLAEHTMPEAHGPAPQFDTLLLGLGPDAHIASLFPGMPALYDTRPAVGVRAAPKPPPTRISLTLPAIRQAREVWFLVSGADKAPAVLLALGGGGEVQVPAAGAYGTQRTLWLLDRAAASKLPPGLERIASP